MYRFLCHFRLSVALIVSFLSENDESYFKVFILFLSNVFLYFSFLNKVRKNM